MLCGQTAKFSVLNLVVYNQALVFEGLNLWNKVLPEKLVVPMLDNKFLTIYITCRFITVFTTVPHMSTQMSVLYNLPTCFQAPF
jgi:hypothetical protein